METLSHSPQPTPGDVRPPEPSSPEKLPGIGPWSGWKYLQIGFNGFKTQTVGIEMNLRNCDSAIKHVFFLSARALPVCISVCVYPHLWLLVWISPPISAIYIMVKPASARATAKSACNSCWLAAGRPKKAWESKPSSTQYVAQQGLSTTEPDKGLIDDCCFISKGVKMATPCKRLTFGYQKVRFKQPLLGLPNETTHGHTSKPKIKKCNPARPLERPEPNHIPLETHYDWGTKARHRHNHKQTNYSSTLQTTCHSCVRRLDKQIGSSPTADTRYVCSLNSTDMFYTHIYIHIFIYLFIHIYIYTLQGKAQTPRYK